MTTNYLYLNNDEYREILAKIVERVNQPDFKPWGEDSTMFGNKYTITNCGVCNDEFCTKENAMFPDQWPQRKHKKYTRGSQLCPFDMDGSMGSLGCFYRCYIFQAKTPDVKLIRQLAQQCLEVANAQT